MHCYVVSLSFHPLGMGKMQALLNSRTAMVTASFWALPIIFPKGNCPDHWVLIYLLLCYGYNYQTQQWLPDISGFCAVVDVDRSFLSRGGFVHRGGASGKSKVTLVTLFRLIYDACNSLVYYRKEKR